MSDQDQAVTWASEAHRKADLRRRKSANAKSALRMFGHKVFWRTLHALGLARPYSVSRCWANLYRRFPDGRCQWCGMKHSGEDDRSGGKK